jgi:Flp pilus assembly protein TadB
MMAKPILPGLKGLKSSTIYFVHLLVLLLFIYIAIALPTLNVIITYIIVVEATLFLLLMVKDIPGLNGEL